MGAYLVNDKRGIWLLDPRFDFMVPWFQKQFHVSDDNLTYVGSYHGPTRRGRQTVTVGGVKDGHVVFLEPEDINRRYANQLVEDTPDVIASFTGAYLPGVSPFRSILATGDIAVKANHKGWQYDLFCRHRIPTPRTWSVSNPNKLRELLAEKLSVCGKVVVKKPEFSGGYQMAVIASMEETDRYLKQVGDTDFEYLVSEYIPHVQSFSGMGIVARDGSVQWCGATEQVLYKDIVYEGLIYPPFTDQETVSEMEELIHRVGEALATEGYYGFFNVDFIFGKTGLYAVEINARFGFGTLLYACFCGESFWVAAQGTAVYPKLPESRIILGKFKGRSGRVYENLRSASDILGWYQARSGSFRTFFCGTEQPEIFKYGSFVGLFGAFLPRTASRETVLEEFWKNCLACY